MTEDHIKRVLGRMGTSHSPEREIEEHHGISHHELHDIEEEHLGHITGKRHHREESEEM